MKNNNLNKTVLETPLYKATFSLLNDADRAFSSFNRGMRHTLGQKMYDLILNMFGTLSEATDFPELRESALREYLRTFRELTTLIKFFTERGYIDPVVYLSMDKNIASIDRQANGWLKKTLENKNITDQS